MIKVSFVQRQKNLHEFEQEFASRQFANRTGVLLQTCNRLEFYEGDGMADEATIRHLFRVVSGLESNLIGEIAIQGQVKQAYEQARGEHKLSSFLHILFQTALYVGKRVRTESGISRGATSHSQAAAEIICKSNINLNHALITIVGVHKLNEDIIRFLQNKGAETLFLGNKSYDKAQTLAAKYNCNAFRLDQLSDFLKFTDVLITATSAPHLIVTSAVFPKGKEMLILDLAYPRDVDEEIGQLSGVQLFNITDVEDTVNQNIDQRKLLISKAEDIIEEEIEKLLVKQQRYVTNYAKN